MDGDFWTGNSQGWKIEPERRALGPRERTLDVISKWVDLPAMRDRSMVTQQGAIVRHFKRELMTAEELKMAPYKYLYRVLGEGLFTEELEIMFPSKRCIVYEEVFGLQTFIRPLEMFISRVDRVKYPDVKQEFRFDVLGIEVN